MADITENVIVTTPTVYTLPVWRQYGSYIFLKIYTTSRMLIVNTETGKEYIKVGAFPFIGLTGTGELDLQIQTIGSTVEIDEATFGVAYDATQIILAAL